MQKCSGLVKLGIKGGCERNLGEVLHQRGQIIDDALKRIESERQANRGPKFGIRVHIVADALALECAHEFDGGRKKRALIKIIGD
jgi:hypothetical protein